MKPRIVFVDDEPNVLQGLQRMFRSMRQEWEIAFASGGQEALDILGREPYDVVVSDMQMPGMDGAQLLNEVMRLYPHVVRIVLSGYADEALILKSVRPAHQYLSKPCDAAVLKSTIERAFALRNLLVDESVKKLVSRVESLPSLPTLYVEIMEELQSPESSMQKIGEIISKDIGMTAKILQLVNSAFFGPTRKISSATHAVSLLGIEIIKALAISVGIFSEFDQAKVAAFSFKNLWTHCLQTGIFAKAIVEEERREQKIMEEAFMAGMLHDLGKLVLARDLSEQYAEALTTAQEENRPAWEVEQEMLGATHAEIGAYLTGLWGMPAPIVEAIAFHHNPRRCLSKRIGVLTAVHVGNVFEHDATSQMDTDYLSELALIERVALWQDKCNKITNQREENE